MSVKEEGAIQGTHNVVISAHCWLAIGGSKSHVEVDEDASVAFRCTLTSEEDIVMGDIAMEDLQVRTYGSWNVDCRSVGRSV